jgi:phosphate starvation-inducible PhoH-like protein
LSKKARRVSTRTKPGFDRNHSHSADNIIEIPEFQARRTRRKARIDIVPRNLNQETMLFHLQDETKDIIFAIGPAGCGKTLLATEQAIKDLRAGVIDKIVITRPNVAVDDRDIGFLPGDILKKMTPWLKPILDIFEQYYSPKEIQTMMEENIIEAVPLAYIRGRTFKQAWVIVDEAQGTSPNSMMAILTRIGEKCRMVVTGDLDQTDHRGSNGLRDFLERFDATKSERIAVVQFGRKDVERHPVVRDVLKMYDQEI